MKTKLLGILIGLLPSSATLAAQVMAFVSFSMPTHLLEETLTDCAHLKIPAYLNGLYNNSMQETARQIMAFSERIPKLSLQIDPTAFERFGIQQVPALVVTQGEMFDVIYGHLPLEEGLSRLAERGDSHLAKAEVKGIK